jgi:uncharacterized protein YndB with AHSA1/START domain
VTRTIDAPPERVWDVLADGWLYPVWVVGASRMRDVDATWPTVGSRLHHSVGVWPAVLDDTTEVLESEPCRRLALRARTRPFGEATVKIRLIPTGVATEVEIEEHLSGGPAAMLPPQLTGPPLFWRNVETLRRLAFIAENR